MVYGVKPSYSNYQFGAHYHSEAVGHIGQKPKFLGQAKGKQKVLAQNSRSLDTGMFEDLNMKEQLSESFCQTRGRLRLPPTRGSAAQEGSDLV